jgi:UDP-N-acetylmuramoyl-L-alanyl-D-glutamate--2,6-diaminopimelate ligase
MARHSTAVFTNFTQDHLDYHGSMADYWLAKRALFDWPGLQAAVINVDDPAGAQLHSELFSAGACAGSVEHLGPRTGAVGGAGHCPGRPGAALLVVEGAEQHMLQTRVIGHYNVLNLLGVLATLRSQGVPLADAVQACAQLQPVPGRMERLVAARPAAGGRGLRPHPRRPGQGPAGAAPAGAERGGQLWCVFGCGGDRDAGKRPLMGRWRSSMPTGWW